MKHRNDRPRNTWESLNNDLATLDTSEEDVSSEEPDSEDDWEDASEVPLN